jgi:beta-lactamase superfamily II metal-dependent hydrolase
MSTLAKIFVKVFPALNGDSLLISCVDQEINMLIDCGYPDTYREYLLPELRGISLRGGKLDLLVITHIDADHLMGAIPFLKDNFEQFIAINQVWHNTFRHIQPLIGVNVASTSIYQPVLQELIQRGYRAENNSSGEISAQQGTTVGALILKNNYRWNTDFQGKAVSTDNRQSIPFGTQGSIFMLSPGSTELAGLSQYWQQELRKYDIKPNQGDDGYFDDAFEMMLSWEKNTARETKAIAANDSTPQMLLNKPFKEDTGVTNGSSIAFILAIGDKKLLLLGDAHPAVIVRELGKYQSEGVIIFDLVKLAHHGSFNNVSQPLLERIDSPSYVFSANGKHGHPNKETIAHIICRKANFLRTLYFNYQTENSEFFNRDDWKQAYHYEIAYLSMTGYTFTL